MAMPTNSTSVATPARSTPPVQTHSLINQCDLSFFDFSVVDADLGTVLGEGSVIKNLVMDLRHYKNQTDAPQRLASARREHADKLRFMAKISEAMA
jgi:hypothetical protein